MKILKYYLLLLFCISFSACSKKSVDNVSLWNTDNLVFMNGSENDFFHFVNATNNFVAKEKIKIELQMPTYTQYLNDSNYINVSNFILNFVALHPEEKTGRLFFRADFDAEIKILDKSTQPYFSTNDCTYEIFEIDRKLYENCSNFSFERLTNGLGIKNEYFPAPYYPDYGFIYDTSDSEFCVFDFYKKEKNDKINIVSLLENELKIPLNFKVSNTDEYTYFLVQDQKMVSLFITTFILNNKHFSSTYTFKEIYDYFLKTEKNSSFLICLQNRELAWIDLEYSSRSKGIIQELENSRTFLKCRLNFSFGNLIGFNHTSKTYFTENDKQFFIDKTQLIEKIL